MLWNRARPCPAAMDVMTTAQAQQLPMRRLTCARCGTSFDCGTGGKDGGCWCMDEAEKAPMPTAASEDCVCPACLRAKIAALARGSNNSHKHARHHLAKNHTYVH